MTEAEHKSELDLRKDTLYLTLTGELWGIYCGNFKENRLQRCRIVVSQEHIPCPIWQGLMKMIRAHFLSFTQSELRLCSANHRAGYFSNLACDWLSIVWAYSEQETENGPWWCILTLVVLNWFMGTSSYSSVHFMKVKGKFNLLSQYRGCWWPDDARSQGISSHGIDLVIPEYSGISTERVNLYFVLLLYVAWPAIVACIWFVCSVRLVASSSNLTTAT